MIRSALSALLICASLTLSAQEISEENPLDNQNDQIVNDTVKKRTGELLQEVIISTGAAQKPISIGKLPVKSIDLPQADAVISSQTIEQQQIIRLSDALRNANGVYVSGASNASGNNQEEFGARGFTFSGANTFKNGVRFNGSLIPEVSSIESIEILKGSSALLFGNTGPGGILNLVTKKPKFTSGGEVSLRWSEYDFYKPIVDVYGSINNSDKFAYRVVTTYEKGHSFRDVVSSERFYINPSVLYKLSDKTNLLFEADYLKDFRTPDFGLTTINYRVIEQPRNTFLGFDWGRFDSMQQSLMATLTHAFSGNWQIKGIASYQGYHTALLSSLRPNATNLVAEDGTWRRGVQKNEANQDYAIAQVDLTGSFFTGKIRHNVLIGSDADQSNTMTHAYKNITFFDEINIFDPETITATNPVYEQTAIPEFIRNTNTSANIKRFGIYAQDLVELSPKFKALLGLRYSYLENFTTVFTFDNIDYDPNDGVDKDPSKDTKSFDRVFSPKAGLVYQPTKNHSIFGSYSNSFALNTGTDRNLDPLPHSTIHQYEAGSKNFFLDGKMSVNLTGYVIDYSNLAQTDFTDGNTNTNIKELAGSYQSKGVELDIAGSYRNLRLMAGYSFNETKYTESNIYPTGTLLRFSPKHTANASLFYTFTEKALDGLELGIISAFTGERLGGRLRPLNASTPAELARTPIPVEGFLQLDASVGYSIGKVTFRARLANLTNATSYYVYDDNTVTPIAPRLLSAAISYKF